MISLIHPTRERPDMCLHTIRKWVELADQPDQLDYLLGVDLLDVLDYRSTIPSAQAWGAKVAVFTGPRLGYPAPVDLPPVESLVTAILKVNRLCNLAFGDHLFYIADDYFPIKQGWDTLILEKGLHPGYGVYDSDGVFCHPVMSREYFQHLGYFFHPGYIHLCADIDLLWTAKLEGRFVPSVNALGTPESTFAHVHPCNIGHEDTPWDAPLNVANQSAVFHQGNVLLSQRHPALFEQSRTIPARKLP